MPNLKRTVKRVKNAFRFYDTTREQYTQSIGTSSYSMLDGYRAKYGNERTIVSSIYMRIAIDVAGIPMRHVKLDDQGRYLHDIDSPLNDCFTLEPNIDQGPRAFRQNIAGSLFDEGCVAIVPVNTTIDDMTEEVVSINDMRLGTILQWYPRHVRIRLYNESIGDHQEIIIEKQKAAIVQNPLYAVMNAPNSTLQRLVRKLSMLDSVDEATSSGKLDLIIQLPYVIKSDARRRQAESRREDIEFQLKQGKYGIAYTDGTEKITQLNRPAENNLLKQIEYLTELLYSQLGITKSVMDGTADEATMINYYNRTVEPILDAIREAEHRSFIGKKGTNNKEKIEYFNQPFKLVPVSNLAEVADKFTRNEILTSNEFRGILGLPPHPDPKADQLVNSNMPQPVQNVDQPSGPTFDEIDGIMNEVFAGLTSDIEELSKGAGDGGG